MKRPEWQVPPNLQDILDEEEMWEDERWSPILLTAMSGTEYGGRDIPIAWQIEFEPGDKPFKRANQKIEQLGLEADGYGWAALIKGVFSKSHPDLSDSLHFGDTETETCVVWTESEEVCQTLLEVVWSLIYES